MTTDNHENQQLDELVMRSYQSLRNDVPGQREAVLSQFGTRRDVNQGARHMQPVRTAVLALAGCTLLAVTVRLFMLVSAPRVAYGLDTAAERLLDVQTIRLRGTQFFYDAWRPESAPQKVPFEYVLKRPDKFRYTWTSSQQKKEGVVVENGSLICDGRISLIRNDTKKQFSSAPVLSPLSVRIETEKFAQIFMLTAMLGPPETPFHKVGEEKVAGRWCQLYEGQFEDTRGTTITKLWFDPTRGHPVRLVRDDLQDDGTTRRDEEIDEITVNESLADELFAVTPPEGYGPLPRDTESFKQELALSPYPQSSGSAMGTRLETWYSWRLSDRAALVVWRRSAPAIGADQSLDWLSNVEFKLDEPNGKQTLRHGWVYQSGKADVWNWSVVTVVGGEPPPRIAFELQVQGDRGVCSMALQALRFSDNELEKILLESARSTLPADVHPPSLADLRARASRLVSFGK